MRHRSHAFQTRLCLASMPAPCVTWSWWWAWAAFPVEPARFEIRFAGLVDLVLDDVLFLDSAALGSSAGGEGRLCDPIVQVLC